MYKYDGVTVMINIWNKTAHEWNAFKQWEMRKSNNLAAELAFQELFLRTSSTEFNLCASEEAC